MDDGEQQYPKRRSNGGHVEGKNLIVVVGVGRIMLLCIKCAVRNTIGRWMDSCFGVEL